MKRLMFFKSGKDFLLKLFVSQVIFFLVYLFIPFEPEGTWDTFADTDFYLLIAGLFFVIMTFGYVWGVISRKELNNKG
jgi:hypothetical protein